MGLGAPSKPNQNAVAERICSIVKTRTSRGLEKIYHNGAYAALVLHGGDAAATTSGARHFWLIYFSRRQPIFLHLASSAAVIIFAAKKHGQTRMRTILTNKIIKWQTRDSVWVLTLRIIAILLLFPAATAFAQTATIIESGNIYMDYICSGSDCSTTTPSAMDSTFNLTSTFDPSTAISICDTGVPGCSGAGEYTFTTGTTTFSSAIFNDSIPISASYSNNGGYTSTFSLNYFYGSDLYGLVRMNSSTLTSAQFYSGTVPGVAIFTDLYGNPYVPGLPTIPDPVANNNVNFTESYTGSPASVEGLGGIVVYINDGNPTDTNQIIGTVNSLSINSGSSTLPPPPPPMPSTLFSPGVKSFFGNVANVATVAGAALSLGSFDGDFLASFDGVPSVVQGTVDSLGLLGSAPNVDQIVAQQVLDSGNLKLAEFGLGLGCTIGFEAVVPCLTALAGLDLALLGDIADTIKADPTDPNYQTVFIPTIEASPVPLTGVCSGLGTSAEAVPYALDQTNEWADALYVTNNRYQTALSAGDQSSAVLQETTFGNYLGSFYSAAQTADTDLSCFASLLTADDLGLTPPTAQDEANALGLIEDTDPSSLDSLLEPYGFTDSEIANLLAEAEADPPALPTELIVDGLDEEAQSLATPEPNSLVLLGSGIVGFVVLLPLAQRRRRI